MVVAETGIGAETGTGPGTGADCAESVTWWDWRSSARCRDTDSDPLGPAPADQRALRTFCGFCVVRTECLAFALDRRIESGTWGGVSARERRAVLRAWDGVGSWATLLGARHTYPER
ncbi:transcriptional regulator WblA [Pseudonocardia ailaonensis]|uniref:Transcriptional regulator WhiB n=1 Tax=Pseudonocardia ailaonensis TaxID=367279 RepID=A0ABN2MSF7_9PSEU